MASLVAPITNQGASADVIGRLAKRRRGLWDNATERIKSQQRADKQVGKIRTVARISSKVY